MWCFCATGKFAAREFVARLNMVAGLGFAILILSGIAMVWANGCVPSGRRGWFWVEMAPLVAVFAAAVTTFN